MGKKLGFGFLGLLVVGAIYYFTTGSTLIASEIKKQVNAELLTVQTHGFKVEERKIDEKKEHFVLSFDNPEKITDFLNTQGIQVTTKDVEALKGLKLGVDIAYVSDVYSAVSIDMYPLTLPDIITSASLDAKDKSIITQLYSMLKNKAFLVHLDVNKLGTGFKGYVKNINETIQDDTKTSILLEGLTFEGSLKDKKLHKITQNLKELKLLLDEKITLTLQGLQSNYMITGKTNYDYESSYTIDTMQMNDTSTTSFSLVDTKISSTSKVQDNLMDTSIIVNVNTVKLEDEGESLFLDTFVINTQASNLDITAFEKLQHLDPNNEKEMTIVLQQLISKGVSLNINTISAQNINYMRKTLDDFNLTAHLDIDKSLNITALQQNPLLALPAIDANLKLSLSPALFGLISEQPKAIIMLMLFQPQDVNGKKVYSVELKDGKLTVNGMSVM